MPIVNGGDERVLILTAEAYLEEHRRGAGAARVRALIENLRTGKTVEDLDPSDRPVIREIIAWSSPRSSPLTSHFLAEILSRIGVS